MGFRYMLGLSQEKLALNAGIERTRLQRIEHGKRLPSGEEMEAIALSLASTVEECFPPQVALITDEDDMVERVSAL